MSVTTLLIQRLVGLIRVGYRGHYIDSCCRYVHFRVLLIIGLWLVGEKPSSHSLDSMLLSDRLCSIISVLAAMLPRPLVLFTLPTWFGRSSNFVFSPPANGLSLFLHSNSFICLHAGSLTSCSGCHCLFIKFFGQVSSSQSILRLARHGVGICLLSK